MAEATIGFLDMFSHYAPPEELQEALTQAAIVAADIDPTKRSVHVNVDIPVYVPMRMLDEVCQVLCTVYGLHSVTISPRYPSHQLSMVSSEELMGLFVTVNSMTRGSLAGAQWSWEGQTLTVSLLSGGEETVRECIPAVRNILQDRFGVSVQVEVNCAQRLEGQALYDAMRKMREGVLDELPRVSVAAKADAPKEEKAIFGRPFKGKPVSMDQVSIEMGNAIVSGRVFSIDHRELKKSNAWIINFSLTDNTGSVCVNQYMKTDEAKPILDKIKVGVVVRIRGQLTISKHDGEMVMRPNAIVYDTMPARQDTADGAKRVELHLHTSMSNMDALTNTEAAIKQAAAWGHRAIAITDHGCVQSFTDALHTLEGKKGAPRVAGTDEPIKVLYGCEGYYVNDIDDVVAVTGSRDMALDDSFVAFDLETTGLSMRTDEIIEIGAVLVKNGEEIDRFQTFVDPGRTVSQHITMLTGISNEMLRGAPKIDEAMRRFVEFVGDHVLVAHNADFDIGFVAQACTRLGIDFAPTYVDTLVLAQTLMPKLGRHKLNVVADALGLPEFSHHRAADDALACGLIACHFLEMLRNNDILVLSQVNAYISSLRMQLRHDERYAQHIVLFAKNQLGLRNLYHLISDANLYHFRRVPRILKSELMKLREGLIVGSACENNELFQAVIRGKSDAELKRLASFYDYLEVQPISNNRFMLDKDKNGRSIANDVEQLRQFNRTIVRIGQEMGKLVVATGDVHFLNPEDEIFRHILLASKGFDDADKPNPLYFRTTDEMLREFAYLGEEKAFEIVVTNPNHIADMCDVVRPVPRNLFAPSIENSVEDLKALVYGKMHRLYGEEPPALVRERVETELNDIISCHYDVIYMSAQKLVQNSLENGYLVGSRGSVGSSIVAYMSGITEVNSFPPHYRCPNPTCKYTTFDVPHEYGCGADLPDAVCPKCGTAFEKDGFNIPFETFLGFGGDKIPDIDLNFSGEYQARAHAYCTEMFGRSHVFRAGTVGTVAEKTAFGYVKKFLAERDRVVTKAEEGRLASGCVGVRRTTGQHPGGLVVIPQDNEIWDFCPVQHPADDPNSDQITTHFEYHSMEENLLKLDMLGHDDPTMIRMMEDMTGVDAKQIPLDDKKTMSIFTSSAVLGYSNDKILGPTGAVGVPEFNTRFTRGVLLDTMPDKFDMLVRICGYTHGTDVWLGNAKDLIVSGTARVDQTIGARDDIMLYLIRCGLPEKLSFKIMESVRKGKGLPEGTEQEMVNAGVPAWYIDSCKKIKYLFPKAHAVAYVMMAFRIAWFKVYHPLAFYAAYFYRRSQKGGFDAMLMSKGIDAVMGNIAAIDGNEMATDKDEDMLITLEVAYEFYLRGFEFLPIDMHKSDATKFLIEDGKLRLPFIALSGLGENAALDLVRGRNEHKFSFVEEVAAACPKVSKTHIQMLKEAGAFGDMPETSQVSLF